MVEVRERIKEIVGRIKGNLTEKPEKPVVYVPFKEINLQTVAQAIVINFAGKETTDPFSIIEVLNNMGYQTIYEGDYYQCFRREYLVVRKALTDLSKSDGPLKRISFSEVLQERGKLPKNRQDNRVLDRDSHLESQYYQVENVIRLLEAT